MIYLETDRIRLEDFTPHDMPLLFELDSDPEVMLYLNGGHPTPMEDIKEISDRIQLLYVRYFKKFGVWKAFEKSSGEYMGGSS